MSAEAKKLYDALLVQYPNALQSITDISRNTSQNKNFVECGDVIFNYDFVYNLSPSHGRAIKEKSPDALFFNGSTLYFVEFKEASLCKEDVRSKAHEGINTLYQFCRANQILTLSEFLSVDFRYALVFRHSQGSSNSFLAALESTSTKFDLKNLEGFIYKETCVRFTAAGILKLLNSASGNQIKALTLVAPNQTDREVVTC